MDHVTAPLIIHIRSTSIYRNYLQILHVIYGHALARATVKYVVDLPQRHKALTGFRIGKFCEALIIATGSDKSKRLMNLRGDMTAKRLITGILTVMVIAALMAPSLMAQSLVTGDLTGTVTDPSGAVVSGATVALKSDANGSTRTATTGSNGSYRFSLLGPGSYTVTVTASGFSKAQSTAQVNVGQASIADVKMAIGSSSQTVEVTGAAPLVNADNADLSTNFDQNMIANQPNGGNDITYVAQTAPGVTMNTGMGYGNFQTSGLPATSNVFTVNGENDMDPFLNLNNSGATNLTLGRNDLQEATVITNAYSGQYGQQAGVQVSYVTKSGTNQFHGNAEYWWTGRAMDANDYFNNLSGTPRPFANNNEWAASFGGPIKKDKLFFFADTEGIRYIVPSSRPSFLPLRDLQRQRCRTWPQSIRLKFHCIQRCSASINLLRAMPINRPSPAARAAER